jgi:hypothetical protein
MQRLVCVAVMALVGLTPLFGEAAPPTPRKRVTRKPPPKPEPVEPEPDTRAPETTTSPPPPAPAVAAPDIVASPSAAARPDAGTPATAASPDTKEEEVTDFEEEEKKLDERIAAPVMPPTNGPGGPPGRGPGGAGPGYKLILDLLLLHTFGTKQLSFYPNHTLAILMLNVTETISVQVHIAPDPAFYELAFAVTPKILLKAGKILVPFGTNNFHHIIGGRVDQQSRFLPETWGDYGVAINHLLIDTRYVSVEYDAYVVNGLAGATAPVIGVGTITDNNFAKGLGARVVVGLPKGIRLIGSVYHSLWNVENNRGVLFYSAGAAMPVGAINLPVLNRIGLRGEWSRGELQYPNWEDNVQRGLTPHAVAKAGFYGELTVRLFDVLALRVRGGRMNPNNTVGDDEDVELLEPAIVIGSPKLSFLAAWQFTKRPNRRYSPTLPADVVYAKVFLQY